MNILRRTFRRYQRSSGAPAGGDDERQRSFRVRIPDGILPGQEFTIYVYNLIVRVQCPRNASPGQLVKITVPDELPVASRRGNVSAGTGNWPFAFKALVPHSMREGQRFQFNLERKEFRLRCPKDVSADTNVWVVQPFAYAAPDAATSQERYQFVLPGDFDTDSEDIIYLLVDGDLTLVAATSTATPGPIREQQMTMTPPQDRQSQTLFMAHQQRYGCRRKYLQDLQQPAGDQHGDVIGWTGRFTWTPCWDTSSSQRHLFNTAYVRQLNQITTDVNVNAATALPTLMHQTCNLNLVKASDVVFDSFVVWETDQFIYSSSNSNNKGDEHQSVLVTAIDVAHARTKCLDAKVDWFDQKCDMFRVGDIEGHVNILVHPDNVLHDCMEAIVKMTRHELQKPWRLVVLDDDDPDSGGQPVVKEWDAALVQSEILDPELGLFRATGPSNCYFDFNTDVSNKLLGKDVLLYYRFVGRVVGKALHDKQLMKQAYFLPYIVKHIVGWPVSLKDVKMVNADEFKELKQMIELYEDGKGFVKQVGSRSKPLSAVKPTFEKENGTAHTKMDVVTDKSFLNYFEAAIQYQLLERVKAPLKELLFGIYDVVPQSLLTIFDFQELQFVLCGLPRIDVGCWKTHTKYSGKLSSSGEDPVSQWFWEVVQEQGFHREMKARLLQFVTGRARVPFGGFGCLTGQDGKYCPFTLHGISYDEFPYPRVEMWRNRLILPLYKSKTELRDGLVEALTAAATGYDIRELADISDLNVLFQYVRSNPSFCNV